MAIDEQLLQAQKPKTEAGDSAQAASDLRMAQRGQSSNPGQDLRSSVLAAKREKQKQSKSAAATGEKSLSGGTSKILVSAWRSLIPSWGFSFLYVYIHLFLQAIFGKKLFAPLGSEWFDRPGVRVEKRDLMGKKLAMSEKMGVGCCSLLLILLIIIILANIALLVEVVTNPMTVIKIGWSWIKNGLSEFFGA